MTYDKKMIKRPIHQFLPANELVTYSTGKPSGGGIMVFTGFVFNSMERVKYVVDFSKMVKNICDVFLFVLQEFRLQGMAILLASDGGVISTPYLTRVTHANTFFACASSLHFCVISQKSHPRRRVSCRTRNVHGLTAFLFLFRTASTPSLLYPLNGSISCNPQHGVPLGRLAEQSPNTRNATVSSIRHRVSLVLLAEVSTER